MGKAKCFTYFRIILDSLFSRSFIDAGFFAKVLSIVVVFLIANACANHACREPRAPELDRTRPAPAVSSGAEVSELKTPLAATASSSNSVESKEKRVKVFKSDGSRQCEPKSSSKTGPSAVDVMEQELAGIKVYAREKRRDGLMHIQVCGSPTGMINLYEIDFKYLKQAEERGFRRWEE